MALQYESPVYCTQYDEGPWLSSMGALSTQYDKGPWLSSMGALSIVLSMMRAHSSPV